MEETPAQHCRDVTALQGAICAGSGNRPILHQSIKSAMRLCVRTTLSIDDDVAAELERLRHSRNVRFKVLVNEALRRGLQEMTAPSKKQKPFCTRTFNVGGVLVQSIDNISELLTEIEGEWHR